MPATTFQNDLQSLTDRFVGRYARQFPQAMQRQQGSYKEEIALYTDMARRDPVTRFCIELVFLYCYSLIGEYTHPRSRVEKDIRKAISNCKGSWSIALKNIMTAAWYGYSWTEVATDDLSNGRKTLKRLRTLNPSRYNFMGTEEGITKVQYVGQRSALVELDYNTGIHIVCGGDISFDEHHGSGRLEASYAYWDLHQLLAVVIAVASQRQATPILVRKTETGTGVDLLDANGSPIVDPTTGLRVTIPKGVDAVRQLAELGSAGVTAIDLDDDLYSIDQKISGDFLLNVVQMCEQYRMMACLVPNSLITSTRSGVGDSGLSDRHMEIFETINAGLVTYVCEEIVDQLIRPLIDYNFEQQPDYGYFPINRSDPSAATIAQIVNDAIARGSFSKNDIEVANKLREKLGISELSQQEFDALKELDRASTQQSQQQQLDQQITNQG